MLEVITTRIMLKTVEGIEEVLDTAARMIKGIVGLLKTEREITTDDDF